MKRVTGVLVCIAALFAVSGAQATQRIPTKDTFTLQGFTDTTFGWSYTNHRAAGTPPVNGETIQITSGNPAILASATFDGVAGTPGSQNAFVFFPITVPPGATVTGTGTTNAPLAVGTTFKFFVTTDGFATTANTFSVDATLGRPTKKRPDLHRAEAFLDDAVDAEKKAERSATPAIIVSESKIAGTTLGRVEDELQKARESGEISEATRERIAGHVSEAKADDVKAERAAGRKDLNSAKHWLAKAEAEKATAMHLITAALNAP